MSCKECRNIGLFETIQYEPPDEFDHEGSFSLHGGDSYYDIPNVKYCPFCGSRLKPPKGKRLARIKRQLAVQHHMPADTWGEIAEVIRSWV